MDSTEVEPFNLSAPDCADCNDLRVVCDYHCGFADGWDACADAVASVRNPVDPRPNLQIAS